MWLSIYKTLDSTNNLFPHYIACNDPNVYSDLSVLTALFVY